jgi:colicin import membrane protein
MSENVVEERTCRFPGCQRPAAAAAAGTGRPPQYCDNPAHNRASAWRARQELSAGADGSAEKRPVDSARQRASEITGQVAGMMEHLGQQLAALVEELRTVGDPEAAEAEIESVTSEAAEQVASANARAARAEQAQRKADAEKEEADAAAVEATRKAEELTEALASVNADLATEREGSSQLADELAQVRSTASADRELAEATAEELRAALTAAGAQVTHIEQERDVMANRAEEQERARTEAEQRVVATESRAKAEEARADRADAATEAVRRQLESARTELEHAREAIADLRGNVATLTAEREAARADIERERAHGEQRVQDLHNTYGRQVDQLREELSQTRQTNAQEVRRVRSAGEDDSPKLDT